VAFFEGVKASSFYIHTSILSSIPSVCSSWRMESFVLWSLRVWPARGLNNFTIQSPYNYSTLSLNWCNTMVEFNVHTVYYQTR
jgi:hypothetical protein